MSRHNVSRDKRRRQSVAKIHFAHQNSRGEQSPSVTVTPKGKEKSGEKTAAIGTRHNPFRLQITFAAVLGNTVQSYFARQTTQYILLLWKTRKTFQSKNLVSSFCKVFLKKRKKKVTFNFQGKHFCCSAFLDGVDVVI